MSEVKPCVLNGGRLVVEPYPPKKQFVAEATRTDCDSWPVLHVEVCHDTMTTTDLFNLLHHDFPPRHVSARTMMKFWRTSSNKGVLNVSSMVMAPDITLNPERQRDWSNPADWTGWSDSQIELWTGGNVTRSGYLMWIAWARKVLKREARYARIVGGKEEVYNPFSGLRFRVRVEFHD